MAAPAKQRFFNIKDFKHGSADYNTIKEVSWQEETEVIEDSGDDDSVTSFLEAGLSRCQGTVLIADPVQAVSLKSATQADITFKGKAGGSGTDGSVTIKGVRFFGSNTRTMHNGVWVSQLTFRAHDPAGGALITVTGATGGT